MSLPDTKTRCVFSLTTEHAEWIRNWLKRNNAPPVMFSVLVDEYVAGLRSTLESLEGVENPSLGDLFQITGKAFNKLKEASLTYAPELKQLVEKKLPDPTKIKHTSEFDVSAAFWQDLSLSDIPYTQLTAFPVKEMLINEEEYSV